MGDGDDCIWKKTKPIQKEKIWGNFYEKKNTKTIKRNFDIIFLKI